MNDLGAVGLPAPFHALFDPYTTPQGNYSDRRPSKNRLLAILQNCRTNEHVIFRLHARERGKRARESCPLPSNTLAPRQFWGTHYSLLQKCLHWTLHYNSRKVISHSTQHSERVNTIPGTLGKFLLRVVHEAVEKASDQSFLFVAPQPAMKQKFSVFMCIQSICRFFSQKEFPWSYLSHNRISYGVQIHTAFVSQMKKHVSGLHSLWTWDKSNKNDFLLQKKGSKVSACLTRLTWPI